MYKEFILSRGENENTETNTRRRVLEGDHGEQILLVLPLSSCSKFSFPSQPRQKELNTQRLKSPQVRRLGGGGKHSSKVNLLEQPAQASKPSSLFLSVEGEGLEVFFELLLFFKAEFFVKEGHFFVVVEGNAFLLFSGFDSLTVVCFDFQA